MSDTSVSPSGDPVDADGEAADASLTYHRSKDGSQVLLGIENDGIHCSIAFEAGTGQERIERLLEEQRRELEHYYETARDR